MKKLVFVLFISFLYSFSSFSNPHLDSYNTTPAPAQSHQLDHFNPHLSQSSYTDMETYIIQLLKVVFPDKTAYYYPSVKAKRELDQIIDYINTTDARDQKSQMLIQIFIDALFHEEGFVRTNAAVFLSDITNRQIMEPMLINRLHYLLNGNTIPEHTASRTSSPSTTYKISAQSNTSLPTVASEYSKQNKALAPIQGATSTVLQPLTRMGKVLSFFIPRNLKPASKKQLAQQLAALHVLANMRNPVGQQDFALQEKIFNIAFNKKINRKFYMDLRVTAIRALLNVNPDYPGFPQRLADCVLEEKLDRLHEDYFTRSFWIRATAASALAKIQPSDNDIYRKLKQSLETEEHYPELYALIKAALDSIQKAHFKRPVHTFTQSPSLIERQTHPNTQHRQNTLIHVPDHSKQVITHTIQEAKRATDLRISVGYSQEDGSQQFFFASDFPKSRIKELEDLHRKGLYGFEFVETLTDFLTHSDIYLRSTATTIAKEISINEKELIDFLNTPGIPHTQKFSAVKLWALIEPDNPRLHQLKSTYGAGYKVKSSRRCPNAFGSQ